MANIWSYIWPAFFGGHVDVEGYANAQQTENLLNDLRSGKTSAEAVLGRVASGGLRLSPEQESYLSSMLSNQRTNEARDYETMMANTDLLRAASQLGSLGLSPYNVLQTGGSAVPDVSAAATPVLNNANQRYDRLSHLANSLIGMAGRMASAGIYGGSLAAVRKAAASAAALTSHSAREIRNYDARGNRTGSSFLYSVNGNSEDEVMKYFGI